MIKTHFKNAVLLPGTVGAVLAIAMFLTLYFSGIYLFDLAFRLDVWITLPFIGISIWYFRKVTGGQLHFWQGLVLGFFVNWVFLIVYSTFVIVFLEVLAPDFLDQSITQVINAARSQEEMIRQSDPKFDYETELSSLIHHAKNVTTWSHIADKFIWFSILGTIFTFLLSVILRK